MTTMASQITSLTIVYSIVYSDAGQRHQSSVSLVFVWGIHRWLVTGEFPAQGASNAENVSIVDKPCTSWWKRIAFRIWHACPWTDLSCFESCVLFPRSEIISRNPSSVGFVVVNVDALAQASDIQIERRQVVFLCWMQDLNPGSQTSNRQQTECPLTNRLSYRGSRCCC